MNRSDWNILRHGDDVAVHLGDTVAPPVSGYVRFVERGEREVNKVGIRLRDLERTVIWPGSSAVHLVPSRDDAACWRCELLALATVDDADEPSLPGRS